MFFPMSSVAVSLVIILIVERGLLAVATGGACMSLLNCGSKPSQNWIFSVAAVVNNKNQHLCIASYALVPVGGSTAAMLVTSEGCSSQIRMRTGLGATVKAQLRDDTLDLIQGSITLSPGLTGFRLNTAPEMATAITLHTEQMSPGKSGTTENWKNGKRVSSTSVRVVDSEHCHIQPGETNIYFCVENVKGKEFKAWNGSPFYIDQNGTPLLAGVLKFDERNVEQNSGLRYHTYVSVNNVRG